MRILSILWLTACAIGPDEPSATTFDCGEVALEDGLGEADPCDVSACRSCVEACGGDCVVLESYPPRYSCGDGGSWDVYDSCADWTRPEA